MHPQDIIRIPLTKGYVAIIDAEDADLVLPHRWIALVRSHTVYVGWRHDKHLTLLHRYLLGANKGQYVDHVNGNGLDNTRANIRLCGQSLNGANRKALNRNNTSGYHGVCWATRDKRWIAQIMVNREHRCLGYFKDPTEAARAYDEAAKEAFGEFARLNFP